MGYVKIIEYLSKNVSKNFRLLAKLLMKDGRKYKTPDSQLVRRQNFHSRRRGCLPSTASCNLISEQPFTYLYKKQTKLYVYKALQVVSVAPLVRKTAVESARFESRPGHSLSSLRFSFVPIASRQILGKHLRWGQFYFPPHPF
jgi:hypothetical protein